MINLLFKIIKKYNKNLRIIFTVIIAVIEYFLESFSDFNNFFSILFRALNPGPSNAQRPTKHIISVSFYCKNNSGVDISIYLII